MNTRPRYQLSPHTRKTLFLLLYSTFAVMSATALIERASLFWAVLGGLGLLAGLVTVYYFSRHVPVTASLFQRQTRTFDYILVIAVVAQVALVARYWIDGLAG